MPHSNRFPRVRRALAEVPWAIHPAAFEAIVEVVERRAAGIHLEAGEIEARTEAARRPRETQYAAPGAIAVLPIFGALSHRMHLMENVSSSGTSAEAVLMQLQALVADPNVGAIVLDIDSPGGSVFGITELAEAVYAAREVKPVVAVANSMAASAAYWIASQASELVVTPSGEVGSIGVFCLHADWSKNLEQEGVKTTFIFAGKHKVDGNPYEPLSDEAREYEQSRVDEIYADFTKSVARGRGVSQAKARGEEFGEGRMIGAQRAVAVGLADRVDTLQATIARLAKKLERKGRTSAEVEQDRLRLQLAEVSRRES